tara:strand:+ start:2695 stop:3891 length:1197 start_codon:yes stop_codon:yes gene_type:complete
MEKEKKKLFAEINDQEIRYAVFQLAEDSNYKLIAKKNSKNNGIKHGVVTDLNIAIETVARDLKEIEKNLDKVFDSINLIINQREMSSTNVTSFKKLNGAKVEKRDLDYILNEGKISISKNEEKNSILHILNSNFYLDKKRRDKIPLNIFGDHLGLQMTFLSLPKNNIKNIKNLFENNDLKVDRLLCRPLTTGINLVNENDSLKNFFLLNIDDELSTISIYENSSLVFFRTFSFGTNVIRRDLSQLCSIKDQEVISILNEINFNKKIEDKKKYIDQKFFKESQFTKLSLSHFRDIIDSRIQEMMNYLFNKNSNLNYFKNKLSHIYLVFENKVFQENLGEIFTGNLNFNSDKIALRLIALDDLPLLGAAELTFRGWHAEAVPYVQEKKSLFTGVFSRFFK